MLKSLKFLLILIILSNINLSNTYYFLIEQIHNDVRVEADAFTFGRKAVCRGGRYHDRRSRFR